MICLGDKFGRNSFWRECSGHADQSTDRGRVGQQAQVTTYERRYFLHREKHNDERTAVEHVLRVDTCSAA